MKQSDCAFISYARVDGQEFAQKLFADLRRISQNPWLDTESLSAGSDFDREIDSVLSRARVIIVVLTPGAVVSNQVRGEWNSALNAHIPVIPLLAHRCEVPRVLSVFNWIDFQKDYVSAFDKLSRNLATLALDHLEYLKSTLEALRIAQRDAVNPPRFDEKINALEGKIAAWSSSFDMRQVVLDAGLREENTERELRLLSGDTTKKHTKCRIVGKQPAEVPLDYVGREQEQAELSRLLADDSTRLVSIVGRGGMGKTALAMNVLGAIERECWLHSSEKPNVDGILFLSTLTTGINLEIVFDVAASFLGSQEGDDMRQIWSNPHLPIEDKIGALFLSLSSFRIILLLDNMEELINQYGEINEVGLRMFIERAAFTSASILILITTRVPISLRRELARYDKHIMLDQGLTNEQAISMLRKLDPNGLYGLRDASEDELLLVCEMTHGVPRAIEVIGTIFDNDIFMSLPELLEVYYGHADVTKFIESSHHHLDADSLKIMSALAVYSRPVSVLAVEYLLQPFFPGINVAERIQWLAKTRAVSSTVRHIGPRRVTIRSRAISAILTETSQSLRFSSSLRRCALSL